MSCFTLIIIQWQNTIVIWTFMLTENFKNSEYKGIYLKLQLVIFGRNLKDLNKFQVFLTKKICCLADGRFSFEWVEVFRMVSRVSFISQWITWGQCHFTWLVIIFNIRYLYWLKLITTASLPILLFQQDGRLLKTDIIS